jgi:hypothetical protein
MVPGAVVPMVWALGRRPCLLFPVGLLDLLDGAARAALLAHELAHVRRRDHWVRLLELAATGLFWWNPVLWWARRELHEAEEQCCDAWAVWATGGDGRPYALALLQAVAFVSHVRLPLPAGASGSIGNVSHLKRRLAMVMQGNTSRSLSWAALAAVFGLALLLLPLFPAIGQDRPAATPAREAPPFADFTDDGQDKEVEALKLKLRELIDAQTRNRVARERVAADQVVGVKARLQEVEKVIAVKKKEIADLQAEAEKLRALLRDPDPAAEKARSNNFIPAGPNARWSTQDPAQKSSPGRIEDLEKKLDRIQKDLEDLRRELRPKQRTGDGQGRSEPNRPAAN